MKSEKLELQSTFPPPLFFRCSFALPPYQSRCKLGAKSVKRRFKSGGSPSLVRRKSRITRDLHRFLSFLRISCRFNNKNLEIRTKISTFASVRVGLIILSNRPPDSFPGFFVYKHPYIPCYSHLTLNQTR